MTAVDWAAILLSVRLAAIVAALLLVIGLPIAHWIAFSRWRWKFLVEAVVALPLVLPPTVLGFYVLVAIGARSPIGTAWTAWTGRGLAFTFEALVLASILYSLPFMVQPIAAAFSQVDPTLIEASSTLGASRRRTFFRVVLPLSLEGVIAGTVLTFAHTLGEFGVVLMVGGNLPGVTRTVSIAIYDQVQALHYEAANQTALLLLVFSFVVLAGVYALRGKPWTT
jgi:molybdate transport system permease protein